MKPTRLPTALAALVLGLIATGARAATSQPTTRPVLHVTVDASAAPQLAAEGEKLKATAIGEYPRLCRELASPGYSPIDTITIRFKDIGPPAYTTWGGEDSVITCQIKWFTDHPDDLGCIVHELTHTVQHYTLRGPPSWVTEGIADWTRWFVFEPADKRPHPNPATANYDDSYRTTAAFLNWCQDTYDKHLVQQLNAACRAGHYHEAIWNELTGHPLDTLGEQWAASLQSAGGTTRPTGRAKLAITLDTTAAPACADFAQRCKRAGEKYYPKIAALLPSVGYTPPDHTTITFEPMDGVAYTQNGNVTCAAQYFAAHPDDVGAIIHELVHVDQRYTIGEQPSWLVEGIADWVRWFNWEPASKRPHADPATAKYDGSYQVTAEFLNWAQTKYDHQLVRQLNNALRKGYYRRRLWQTYTNHSLQQLGDEWKQSLQAKT